MKNDAVLGGVKISIPPTLLVSLIARIDDVRRALTCDVKVPGDALYLLGTTGPHTGASEYLRWRGSPGGTVPRTDLEANLRLYRALESAVGEGLVRSSHALHLGGLGAGLARAAMGGELGLRVTLDHCADLAGLREDVALFAETPGRLLLSVPEVSAGHLEEVFSGLPCHRIGFVTEEPRLTLRLGGRSILDLSVPELKRRWKSTLSA
jgi:phosphoribosylformylglycinamidine synthase